MAITRRGRAVISLRACATKLEETSPQKRNEDRQRGDDTFDTFDARRCHGAFRPLLSRQRPARSTISRHHYFDFMHLYFHTAFLLP